MRCWVRICFQVLRAEYPSYSVWTAFSIFDLRADNTAADATAEPNIRLSQHLDRLAQFFEVDRDMLEAQYNDIHFRAVEMKRGHPGMSNFQARCILADPLRILLWMFSLHCLRVVYVASRRRGIHKSFKI